MYNHVIKDIVRQRKHLKLECVVMDDKTSLSLQTDRQLGRVLAESRKSLLSKNEGNTMLISEE